MAQKPSGYRLSRKALADLDAIYAYTVERWSERQADLYYGELIAAFEGLAAGTKLGVRVLVIEGYFKLPVGSHVVFYRPDDERIDIVRILHGAMDVEQHLKP